MLLSICYLLKFLQIVLVHMSFHIPSFKDDYTRNESMRRFTDGRQNSTFLI